MKALKDLKVGDEVVIYDANRRRPDRCRVRSVGRKYFYVNLMWLKGFDRETGRMQGSGVGNVHAMTEEQEALRARLAVARRALQERGIKFDYSAKPEVILACARAIEELDRGKQG